MEGDGRRVRLHPRWEAPGQQGRGMVSRPLQAGRLSLFERGYKLILVFIGWVVITLGICVVVIWIAGRDGR